MKLSEAKTGEYTVHRVMYPVHRGMAAVRKDGDKMERRLRVLGIYPGSKITLAEIGAGDVRILYARGMRLAVGRQIASRITVNPR